LIEALMAIYVAAVWDIGNAIVGVAAAAAIGCGAAAGAVGTTKSG